jgi:hypothetical protein
MCVFAEPLEIFRIQSSHNFAQKTQVIDRMIENEKEKSEDKFETKTKNLPELKFENGEKGHENEGGQDA